MMTIDWDTLLNAAVDAAAKAYVPYSGYPVGAAALVDDGRIVVGCNVENAAYGVTLCAECGLISSLIVGGGGKLLAFCCVNRLSEIIMPCGRCRQLLHEHAAADLILLTPLGEKTMDEVLPQAFGPDDLTHVRST